MMLKDPADDDNLWSAIMANDVKAFERLYNIYWKPLFLTAAKVLRSTDEAEDVVQNVFLSLWNRRQKIKLTGSLMAYLVTSAKYGAIRQLEKNIARRDNLDLLTHTLENNVPANAETNIHVRELQKIIDRAMENMPPKMFKVYTLSRNEHLSHKQIADQLEISPETVKKHIQNALQILREAISSSNIFLACALFALFYKK